MSGNQIAYQREYYKHQESQLIIDKFFPTLLINRAK
jgi:hypothetical protein